MGNNKLENPENMNNILELRFDSRIGTKLTKEWERILRKYLMERRKEDNLRYKDDDETMEEFVNENIDEVEEFVNHHINYYYHKDGYCQFQLYELLDIFWSDMNPGKPPFNSIFFLNTWDDPHHWAIDVPEDTASALMTVLKNWEH